MAVRLALLTGKTCHSATKRDRTFCSSSSAGAIPHSLLLGYIKEALGLGGIVCFSTDTKKQLHARRGSAWQPLRRPDGGNNVVCDPGGDGEKRWMEGEKGGVRTGGEGKTEAAGIQLFQRMESSQFKGSSDSGRSVRRVNKSSRWT